MLKENKSKEKLCLFFASDYHFEMISLPYINESLKNNKKVIMVTENDLDESVDKWLSNINLSEEEKERISKLDWKNDDINKLREIRNINKEGKDAIIFVKGRENYINNINNNIDYLVADEETKVIDCYDINEVLDDVSNIAKKYDKILSTSGVEKLL